MLELKSQKDEPADIVKLDPNSSLFDQVMALEKQQEEATKEAAAILSKAYGTDADVVGYSNRDNILVITFRIRKKDEVSMPPPEVHCVPDPSPKPQPKTGIAPEAVKTTGGETA